ncbi:calponin [Anaeramoeba ignava]|uniref:Calponin n=1 Tax=Anaeramoeba ignava TaxID=1746090 RepID=A0A9Q0LCZ1_ANAIG|nr:calponin [Anaeramoeba ignava]
MDKKQFGNQMKKWISSIIDKDVDFSIKNRYQLIEDLCYLMSKLEPHLINQNQNKKLTPKEKWNYFINSCLKYGVSQEYLISFHNFLKEGFESRVLLLIYQIGSISKQRQHSIERKKNKKQNLNETKIALKNSNSFENANFKNFQNKKILSNISLTHVKKNLNSNEWTTNSLQKQIFTKKAKEQKTNKKNDSKILQNKKQLENELEIGKRSC